MGGKAAYKMNWHERYSHQAEWTAELRSYLFEVAGLSHARRVLEVGCGTGAILQTLPGSGPSAPSRGPELCGVDLDPDSLRQCRAHAPSADLVRANALALPFASGLFDIAYCHFLLLWIAEPLRALQQMKRATAPSGYVLALAEPDYGARVDAPSELVWLGKQQNEALQRQGAALRRGAELSELFHQAGIRILETGIIQPTEAAQWSLRAWESEWQVLEHDLAPSVAASKLHRFKEIDRQAWERGERVLNVPTYFACGQV